VKLRIEIDGSRFDSLDGFYGEINRVIPGSAEFGGVSNLHLFNEVLIGGYGTPEDGFILVWKNHELSRQRLGYAEMLSTIPIVLEPFGPDDQPEHFQKRRLAAMNQEGPTLFDTLVEIIRDHGPARKNWGPHQVDLLLE
jgi:hypothetical protein